MCGFIVRIGFDTPWSDDFLDGLRSRGPDGAGFWQDSGVEIGHRLLAIIGPPEDAVQPKINARFVLSLNGVILNHREMIERLAGSRKTDNKASSETSDASSLLALWSARGTAMLTDLVGFWAFAVYDRAARELTLVRDQFGAKPLYYWSDGQRFCAASTIKALLQAIGFTPELDYRALAVYARYQLSFGERTFFCGVRRVLPGHLIRFNLKNGVVSNHCWEDIFAPVEPSTVPDERWLGETRALLESSVRQCTIGRRPWTVLASGGIDSTIVARIAQPSEAFHSFYSNPACNELEYAKSATTDIVSRLMTVRASETFDLVDRLRAIVEDFDDPAVGSVILPLDELLARVTHSHRVVLTGTGGDELFAGYARYALARGRNPQASYAGLMRRMANQPQLAKRFEMTHHKGECSWYNFDIQPAEDAFATNFEACFSPHVTGSEAELDAMLRFDRRHFLPGLLNIDDRIGGRHGVEARPALLNQHFVRRITQVPVGELFKGGQMKGLLRRLGAPYLPQVIRQRSDKMGFTTPIGSFVQQSADAIELQLRESQFRHLYTLPKGPLPAREIYSREVFGLLMMDIWLNRYASSI